MGECEICGTELTPYNSTSARYQHDEANCRQVLLSQRDTARAALAASEARESIAVRCLTLIAGTGPDRAECAYPRAEAAEALCRMASPAPSGERPPSICSAHRERQPDCRICQAIVEITPSPEPLDVEAIRKRCDAATPGPWAATQPEERHRDALQITSRGYVIAELGDEVTNEDAAFIAHAREDVPRLLAEIGNLTSELDAMNANFQALRAHSADEIARLRAAKKDLEWKLGTESLERRTAEMERAAPASEGLTAQKGAGYHAITIVISPDGSVQGDLDEELSLWAPRGVDPYSGARSVLHDALKSIAAGPYGYPETPNICAAHRERHPNCAACGTVPR